MSTDPGGAPLRIEAVLCEGERLALLDAIEELRQCFAAARAALEIEVRFHSALSAIATDSGPTMIVTSLLHEMTRIEEPLAAIEARLRAIFPALKENGVAAIFLCTVFRRIDPESKAVNPIAAVTQLERIRRLNFLAAELSHDFDIKIIDLDRSFAHIGGRFLGTDFNLGGSAAIAAAKHVITTTFFAAAFDDFCLPELQDAAKEIYDQRRANRALPKVAVSATKLHYSGKVGNGDQPQTFVPNIGNSGRIGNVWRNFREGRINAAEAGLALLRGAQRRLRSRPNRKTL